MLDHIQSGTPAEKALTSWARSSRFAGSKDRAAVRDHVFDVLRRRRSLSVMGGGDAGRALVLGLLRDQGIDPMTIFGAGGHAPAALTADELAAGNAPAEDDLADLPDWLIRRFQASLGADAPAAAAALRQRADVFLRVNVARATPTAAQQLLQEDGVEAIPVDGLQTALRVTSGARRVAASRAYTQGWVELQDASSQAIIHALPLLQTGRILDYCAGGGGKALAMAAHAPGAQVFAHDISAARMKDIPERAGRAGVDVSIITDPAKAAPFDLILCDAPCSGSGTWRRAPQAKWDLTPDRLAQLCAIQEQILTQAAKLLRPGGILSYATCSVLTEENADQISGFLGRMPSWACLHQQQFLPNSDGDGFFVAVLEKD